MKRTSVPVVVGLLLAAGCAPVLVGALAMHSSKTKGQKKEFVAEFHKTNLEREEAGLKPLDWCTEAFRFDPGWARSLPECKGRIERFEAGDSTAIGYESSR